MSEEIKNCEEEKCCVCKLIKCETCKKFLVVALGTFVGGFCALSLFAALHKPPMMGPHPGTHFRYGGPMMERGFGHKPHHFHKGGKFHRPDFVKFKEMQKGPEEPQKPEI